MGPLPSRIREMTNAYKILVGKPERKRSVGRPGHRWNDETNINMDLQQVVCDGVNWIHLIRFTLDLQLPLYSSGPVQRDDETRGDMSCKYVKTGG
jgi:hypothetical protein